MKNTPAAVTPVEPPKKRRGRPPLNPVEVDECPKDASTHNIRFADADWEAALRLAPKLGSSAAGLVRRGLSELLAKHLPRRRSASQVQ